MTQINLALSVLRDLRVESITEEEVGLDGKSLLRKVQILKEMGSYDQADALGRELIAKLSIDNPKVFDVESVEEFKKQV
jgi:hypothetical protein